MLGLTGRSRIVQVHPTRRCNLRCLHCYSSSGPDQREELEADLLINAIQDANSAGYNVVSFSGGEPLLYKPLRQILDIVHDFGMITTVTTNGMLLDEKRIEILKGRTDLLAISLDGVPASHNRMRANPKAFDKMSDCLKRVKQADIPFGFIFTLTQYNLDELPWVANFALNEGAQLLQIHPLEEVGRAGRCLNGSRPDTIEANYALIVATQLDAQYGDRIRIQLDLVSKSMLKKTPERFFVRDENGDLGNSPLADLVSPLIIEQDGTVVPLQYGFAREYSLGNLNNASLAKLGEQWKKEKRLIFEEFCQRVHKEITESTSMTLLNWYEIARSISEDGVARTSDQD